MRLFVAIKLPGNVKRQLHQLTEPIDGVRWQDSDQYHLTLRFIGEVEDETSDLLEGALNAITYPAFKMDLNGLGYFPPGGYPRVIWAGIDEHDILMSLQNDVEQVCRNAGLEPEKRSFKPHITLGKAKDADKQEVLSYIERHEDFQVEDIPVYSFTLYSSTLTGSGAIHTPEAEFSLSPVDY